MVFSIIRDSTNQNSPRGSHTMAILNTTEDYDNWTSVMDEIKDIKNMVIDGMEYTIEWFLDRDLKFLALCTGVQ